MITDKPHRILEDFLSGTRDLTLAEMVALVRLLESGALINPDLIDLREIKRGLIHSIDFDMAKKTNEFTGNELFKVDDQRCIQNLRAVIIRERSKQTIKVDRAPLDVQITLPPGTRTMRLIKAVVSEKRYARECEAARADWLEEYYEALDSNSGRFKLAIIHLRNTCLMLKVAGLLILFERIIGFAAKVIGHLTKP